MSFPEIAEVQRLTLKPSDRLTVRVNVLLRPDQAAALREWARAGLGIPDDVPLAVLDQGVSLEVAEGP